MHACMHACTPAQVTVDPLNTQTLSAPVPHFGSQSTSMNGQKNRETHTNEQAPIEAEDMQTAKREKVEKKLLSVSSEEVVAAVVENTPQSKNACNHPRTGARVVTFVKVHWGETWKIENNAHHA